MSMGPSTGVMTEAGSTGFSAAGVTHRQGTVENKTKKGARTSPENVISLFQPSDDAR